MTHRHKTTIALLTALVATAVATPSPAGAGEYPVYACEPAFGDVNHSWLPESNNSKLTAYTACPVPLSETRTWNQGLVSRESVTGSSGITQSVPRGAFAALRLRAPAGAGLSRIQYRGEICAGDSDFHVGLLNGTNSFTRWSARGNPCKPDNGAVWTVPLFNTPSIALMTVCLTYATCLIDNKLDAWATLRSATVWVTDSTPPAVSITGGSITTPGWHRGTPTLSVSAGDNVGIRRVDATIDGRTAAAVAGRCDWTLVVPCSTPLNPLTVETSGVSDGSHTLAVAAEDSAGNRGSTSRRVQVDNSPPAGPLELQVLGGEGWRSSNGFDLRWTNPPQTGRAPITGVDYAICPASNRVDDFRTCTAGSRLAKDITHVTGLRVPQPGDWVARLWLRDEAGNVDRQTARSVHLRYDVDPPVVTILDGDPTDPQRIAVAASDLLSAVTASDIEIRRAGSPSWISLPVGRSGDVFIAHVDDAVLPHGRYEVRARARDGAGNERSTQFNRSGEPVILGLPVRVPTRAILGGTQRTRDRKGNVHTVLRRRLTVAYGKRVRVRGRIAIPGGNPLASTNVDVFERTALPAAAWRRVGIAHTDDRGWFQYRAPAGPSRMLRFSYAGTRLIQPTTAYVRVQVRAAASLHVNRRHVVNGDDVSFYGRVLGRLPQTGKLVQLQAYSRGTWRTFATTRARGRHHRWRYAYRFSATRGLVTYRFRAVVPAESGFPYLRGVSRQLRVTVQGL